MLTEKKKLNTEGKTSLKNDLITLMIIYFIWLTHQFHRWFLSPLKKTGWKINLLFQPKYKFLSQGIIRILRQIRLPLHQQNSKCSEIQESLHRNGKNYDLKDGWKIFWNWSQLIEQEKKSTEFLKWFVKIMMNHLAELSSLNSPYIS